MNNEKIKEAEVFAAVAHQGQTRRNGEPYVNHVKRVANLVAERTQDEDLICAAFLHDTLEDCDLTYVDLEKRFGTNIAKLVQALTNDDAEMKKLGKQAYMIQKFQYFSAAAALIKLCDTLNNMSETEKEKQAYTYAQIQKTIQNNPPAYWNVSHQVLSDEILNTFEHKFVHKKAFSPIPQTKTN